MANIAPILWIKGRIRRVTTREVPAAPALPEQRDPETGFMTREARPARPGYSVMDAVVDTEPGGLVTVVFREEAIAEAEGFIPTDGDAVEIPVRCYDNWQGSPGRRYRTNGYSFAGSVYAATAKSRTGGTRAAVSV